MSRTPIKSSIIKELAEVKELNRETVEYFTEKYGVSDKYIYAIKKELANPKKRKEVDELKEKLEKQVLQVALMLRTKFGKDGWDIFTIQYKKKILKQYRKKLTENQIKYILQKVRNKVYEKKEKNDKITYVQKYKILSLLRKIGYVKKEETNDILNMLETLTIRDAIIVINNLKEIIKISNILRSPYGKGILIPILQKATPLKINNILALFIE